MHENILDVDLSIINYVVHVCETYQMGKITWPPFGENCKVTQKLLLTHSDICGPMSVDYSRRCWVYFLKQRYDV